ALKTGCEAVAQGGAGRIGRSKLQIAARSMLVAAIESDTGVRPFTGVVSVRTVHSEALKVQTTENGSVEARVGVGVAARTRVPLLSTTARRAPVATVEAASCSVALIVTFTESIGPDEVFVASIETL